MSSFACLIVLLSDPTELPTSLFGSTEVFCVAYDKGGNSSVELLWSINIHTS